MTWGLAAAGAAAVCYGVASVLQAVGARRTAWTGLNVGLLVRLVRQLPYLAGLGLDLAGFILNVVALRSLPLFLVQSVIAASVGVTALVAIGVLHARLNRLEVASLVALAVGLVLLAVGAQPGPVRPLPADAQWLLLATLPVLAAIGAVAARRQTMVCAVVLAAVAGAGFGAVAIAARGLGTPQPWWHAAAMPLAWAIIGFGGVAITAFASALQRGSVTVAAAVMSGIETVLPSVVGLAVLGDGTRAGVGPGAAAAGFVLTLAGVLGLTPYADVEGQPAGAVRPAE